MVHKYGDPENMPAEYHGTSNGYDYWQCRCNPCTVAIRVVMRVISQSPTSRERQRAKRVARQEMLNEIKNTPCYDCGKMYPSYVMQFDHVPERGEKKFTLSRAHTRSLESIREEVAKCDVVCANCHATRTYGRNEGD